MVEIQQINKKTLHKWSFYINILVFIVIAVFLFLLILDAYNVGKLASQGASGDQISQAWLYIGRDIAFLAIGLTWIFVQLFRNYWLIMQRSW